MSLRALPLALLAALALRAELKPQRFTLPNGLQVVHLEDHEHPLVRMRLYLELRPEDTPPGRQGLAPLLLRMLDQADAADLRALELDRSLESAGIQSSVALQPRGIEWKVLARSRDQDRAMGLLGDRLLRSLLDSRGLDLQRLACWQAEERRLERPRQLLHDRLALEPALRPTLAGLSAITFQEVVAFKTRILRPDRAVLVLHGDLGLDQAKRLVLMNLGTWTAPAETPGPAPAPTQVSADEVMRLPIHRPWLLAEVLAPVPAGVSPEAAALLALLMGRTDALPGADPGIGPEGLATAGEAPEGTPPAEALGPLRDRLQALRARRFTQTDLDRARAAWRDSRTLASLRPEAQMDAALAESLGRGVTEERMSALSPEDLNAALQRWLEPANARSGVLAGSNHR